MILADTCILIDYWKNPSELRHLNISNDKHSICGIVKTELFHGARTDDEADNMLKTFSSFELITIDEYDWEFTGLMLQTIHIQGFTIPVSDMLIAYIGIKYEVKFRVLDKFTKKGILCKI